MKGDASGLQQFVAKACGDVFSADPILHMFPHYPTYPSPESTLSTLRSTEAVSLLSQTSFRA